MSKEYSDRFKEHKKLSAGNVRVDQHGILHDVSDDRDRTILELLDRLDQLEAEVEEIKGKNK